MASRSMGATRIKTVSDYVDDPHVTCLDTFSLNPVPVSHTPGPLEAFCQIPSDNPHREDPDTIVLAPGLDVIDFYASSEKTEVWKDDSTIECLVPQSLQGWEFYTLLHPKPEGSHPVVLNPDASGAKIELLFGRPPGAQQCPSMLFIIVPAGQQYQTPVAPGVAPRQGKAPSRQMRRGRAPISPYSYEKACGNIDALGASLHARLLALCPTHVYDDAAMLPEGASWGLFVGPRHRRLLLLNKSSGRLDVHMLMMFSMDAVFQRCGALIGATARLYEPFGTAEQAAALFSDFDPLKAHCGLTNALIADHIDSNTDGRDDYRRLLGVWPHSFFVSNSSDNLRFLTPMEVQQSRSGKDKASIELPLPHKLEDFPVWVNGPGAIEAEHRTALRKYRTRAIPRVNKNAADATWRGGVWQLLGLHSGGSEDSEMWSNVLHKLGGCAEVTLAGSHPWQEPGKTIDARPVVPKQAGTGEKAQTETDRAAPPGWLDSAGRDRSEAKSSIHWRHSLDLVPGADFREPDASASHDGPPPPSAVVAFSALDAPPPPVPAAADVSASNLAVVQQPSERMSDAFAATLQPPL